MSASLLLETYHQATPAQRVRGRAWYGEMRRQCARISRSTGVPLNRVVATAAITSPDATLASNLRWTHEACRTRGEARVGRYPNAMHGRYAPIIAGTVKPGEGVGGLKVTAFYRAIVGDRASVVLDRWALRAVGHDRNTCTPKQYDRFARVYAEAAASVGEHPADFQAIVWIVLRDAAPTKYHDLHDLKEAAA